MIRTHDNHDWVYEGILTREGMQVERWKCRSCGAEKTTPYSGTYDIIEMRK
jgi:hypothetical protein